MFRQIVKGISLLTVVMTLALTNAALTAHGQSPRHVKAQVPFDFIVGGKLLPAGEYVVRPSSDEGAAIIIQNAATGQASIRLSNSIETTSRKTDGRLVFHRYQDTYFLVEVWRPGMTSGRHLIESKLERSMERELALGRKNYDTVVLLATAN